MPELIKSFEEYGELLEQVEPGNVVEISAWFKVPYNIITSGGTIPYDPIKKEYDTENSEDGSDIEYEYFNKFGNIQSIELVVEYNRYFLQL